MKRLILTMLAAAAFLSGGAQTLRTYYVVFPKNADSTVNEVFVDDFQKTDMLKETVLPTFGKNLADGIKSEIRKSERYGNVEYVPQSWRRTDIYSIAEDKSAAQWVVTGTFDITTDSKRDVTTEIKNETPSEEIVNILPFEVVYYDYMNSTNTKVTMELKDKKGNTIVTYEKEKAAESHPKRDMRDPSGKLKSLKALAGSTKQFFVTDMANQFLPWMKAFNYSMLKIKNRDMKDHVERDRYKELKDMMRDEKDLAKKLDYFGLGELYKTVAEETGLKEAYTNLAYVYEVMGNYTRAKEIYEDLGNEDGIKRVNYWIGERNLLKSFGKDYFEPEI
ncbi:hypothetical protein [Marinilabilia sp.]